MIMRSVTCSSTTRNLLTRPGCPVWTVVGTIWFATSGAGRRGEAPDRVLQLDGEDVVGEGGLRPLPGSLALLSGQSRIGDQALDGVSHRRRVGGITHHITGLAV